MPGTDGRVWRAALRPVHRAGSRGLRAAPVYLPRTQIEADGEPARRYLSGLAVKPFLADGRGQVVALALDPDGCIDEHAADEDIVVLAFAGHARTRVGGRESAWLALEAGDAALWPAGVLHALEAGAGGFEARLVHLALARSR